MVSTNDCRPSVWRNDCTIPEIMMTTIAVGAISAKWLTASSEPPGRTRRHSMTASTDSPPSHTAAAARCTRSVVVASDVRRPVRA